MFILIHSILWFIGASWCTAMDTRSYNELPLHNQALKRSSPTYAVKENLRFNEEKINSEEPHWLKTDLIKADNKQYRFYIPDEVRAEVSKDKALYKKIEEAAGKIQALKGISSQVAGFNLVLFKGDIYIERFLLSKKNAR